MRKRLLLPAIALFVAAAVASAQFSGPLPRHVTIDPSVADSAYVIDLTLYSGMALPKPAKIITVRSTADAVIVFAGDSYWSNNSDTTVVVPDTSGTVSAGRKLMLTGDIYSLTITTAVAGATIEVWGEY